MTGPLRYAGVVTASVSEGTACVITLGCAGDELDADIAIVGAGAATVANVAELVKSVELVGIWASTITCAGGETVAVALPPVRFGGGSADGVQASAASVLELLDVALVAGGAGDELLIGRLLGTVSSAVIFVVCADTVDVGPLPVCAPEVPTFDEVSDPEEPTVVVCAETVEVG